MPWYSAITALATAGLCLLMVTFLTTVEMLGIKEPYFVPDARLNPLERRGVLLLYISPWILIIWYWVKYMVLTKAKASKEEGRSEIYTFEPTKKDKIIYWSFFFISCFSVFIVVGIKALLGHY